MTAPSPTHRHGTLVVLCGDPLAAANRRPQLMREFVERFDRCVLLCPRVECDSIDALKAIGFEYRCIDFANQGMSLLADASLPLRLRNQLKAIGPDHLFVFHMKPILFGGLAARSLGIKNTHFLFAGLGVLFQDADHGPSAARNGVRRGDGKKTEWVRRGVTYGLRLALSRATNLFFQNPDDLATFRQCGIVRADANVIVLNGSGVPLDEFACDPPDSGGQVQFTMITRVLRSKGIFEFCEAAKVVRAKRPGAAQFTLIGPLDSGPDGVPMSELDPWIENGTLNYAGSVDDVRPHLQSASVVVLPSYYMEGTPRILLEALASGRAIITTDSRGCRETVDGGRNGFLVQPKSASELTNAMIQLVDDRELIASMGRESRALAERRYDVRLVNAEMIRRMGIAAGWSQE